MLLPYACTAPIFGLETYGQTPRTVGTPARTGFPIAPESGSALGRQPKIGLRARPTRTRLQCWGVSQGWGGQGFTRE